MNTALERQALATFVIASKRERFIGLLSDEKRRRKLIQALYHFRNFDPRFRVELPPRSHHPEAIRAALTARGAGPICYVLSTRRELDGRELALADALTNVVGAGEGSLLVCTPQLAFYEGESPGDRYILACPLPEVFSPGMTI